MVTVAVLQYRRSTGTVQTGVEVVGILTLLPDNRYEAEVGRPGVARAVLGPAVPDASWGAAFMAALRVGI
jgi:threonine/homoserine efflux transporter RhtA